MSRACEVMSRWLTAIGVLLVLGGVMALKLNADTPTPVNCELCDAKCFLDKEPPNCGQGTCQTTQNCTPCKCKSKHFETNDWCECQLNSPPPP
jgi:hypothetical protein